MLVAARQWRQLAQKAAEVIAFSGLKDETHWVHMEIFEGSYGGRLGKDGMDAVDTLYANTRNNPIEDIETHLPLRVLRYELREDVAGAGKWRGGLGSVREFTFLSDGGASVEDEGHRHRPWGFLGGSEGMPAKLDLLANGTTRAAAKGAAYEHRERRPLRLLWPGRRRLRQPAGARSGEGGR